MNLLTVPYPVSGSKKEILLSSSFFAAAVYIFLVVFQPFGTYNFLHSFKYLLLVPYSLISFLTFTTVNFLLKSKVKAGNWNLLNEISKLTGILSVSAFFCYWYSIEFINHTGFSIYGLMYMFLYTLAIGVPISAIYLLGRYVYLRKESTVTNNQDTLYPLLNYPAKSVTIKSAIGSEVLELSENDFLFASSEGNYCLVHYLENTLVHKRLLRLSLTRLEEQIGTEKIIRCHRSFIINTDKILHVKGNAQGYKLAVQNVGDSVPVSRKYIETVRQFIKML